MGLGVYAAFLYAAILLFNVTLTLPGIAGLVLTLGVAADANIVIFERIKEEVRAGRSVRAAIHTGYTKGFATIVDANVVTAITAMVLFAVATASVRGFALMLLVGTAISMLTAVLATRAFLAVLAGLQMLDSPRLMGAAGGGIPRWLKLDYIGKRRLWFAISGAVVVISVGAIAVKGLNLGIDFKGGTQIAFETPRPVPLDQVREQAAKIGQANARHPGSRLLDGRRVPELPGPDRVALDERGPGAPVRPDLGLNAQTFGVKNVSASFGRQIARGAILAIIVSLLLIVGYISLRFQWQFALPVLVALAHDVLITVGIYALLGQEVTVRRSPPCSPCSGYSIYDTIIIFDRIRENMTLMKRASFRVLGNVSLWETIPRSLATTFITLVPIVSLLLFGGDTLKDFAFALLIGIGAGAYSSIFIAAPMLAMFKEREPEYARRRTTRARSTCRSAARCSHRSSRSPPWRRSRSRPSVAKPVAPVPADGPQQSAAPSAKRERRRERRSGRPHGRAR